MPLLSLRAWRRLSPLATAAVVACASLGAAALTACGKSDAAAQAEPPKDFDASQAITETQGGLQLEWIVTPEGQLWGRLKKDGAAVTPTDIAGGIVATPSDGSAPVERPLMAKNGLVTANLGALTAPVTSVKYTIKSNDTAAAGQLHVPKGGTKALVDAGKVAADAKVEPGTKGPHGGTIEVVGKSVVEIVGNKSSGDVRVYLLDDDRKPIAVREEKLSLVVAVSETETKTVVLTPDAKKEYFVGKLGAATNPHKVTVVVEDRDRVDVAVVGYRPGAVVVVGAAAPRVNVYVVDSWDTVVVVDRPNVVYVGKKGKKGKGHGHGHGKGQVHIKIK